MNLGTHLLHFLCTAVILLFGLGAPLRSQSQKPPVPKSPTQGVPLSELVHAMQEKAKSLESSSGMQLAFQSFTASDTVNSAAPEDLSAPETFADDMRREVLQK